MYSPLSTCMNHYILPAQWFVDALPCWEPWTTSLAAGEISTRTATGAVLRCSLRSCRKGPGNSAGCSPMFPSFWLGFDILYHSIIYLLLDICNKNRNRWGGPLNDSISLAPKIGCLCTALLEILHYEVAHIQYPLEIILVSVPVGTELAERMLWVPRLRNANHIQMCNRAINSLCRESIAWWNSSDISKYSRSILIFVFDQVGISQKVLIWVCPRNPQIGFSSFSSRKTLWPWPFNPHFKWVTQNEAGVKIREPPKERWNVV